MKYAKIVAGVVAEVFDEFPSMSPNECAVIVECADTTEAGQLFDGVVVVDPGSDIALEAAIADIATAYDIKRRGLKDRLTIAQLKDGDSEPTVRAALVAEWQQLSVDQDNEILLLLGV